jgi:imidazolonepropionase
MDTTDPRAREATLYVGISELVRPHAREGTSRAPLDVFRDAAVFVKDGRVAAVGSREQLRASPGTATARIVDRDGRAVVPGLVDSHTHVVFAGSRVDELARRVRGETYEQIAAAGGGIASSARALGQASVAELVTAAEHRLERMLARGTTTVEIKTGYGLVPEQERKHLEAITCLAALAPVEVVATVLAHVVPLAERADREAFVDSFLEEVLGPAAASGAARFADVFVETGAFTPDEARRILGRARELGFRLKLHVDQLHDGQGATLAAELGAVSADHLEYSTESGRRALAAAGVVATILPGCRLFLGRGPWPDGRALREAGCEVAVATDCNPGSSMVFDLSLCGTLASTQCGLTLEESLWAITRGGALALGLSDRGTLAEGERADFVVIDHHDWRSLFYTPGSPPIFATAVGGVLHARHT